MANPWRGERRITLTSADGADVSCILAASHEALAAAMDAIEVDGLADLIRALGRLDVRIHRKVMACFEVVDGDPLAVLEAAPGADGLDAIADVLIGLVKGQTETEQAAEKKRLADHQEALQVAALTRAIDLSALDPAKAPSAH